MMAAVIALARQLADEAGANTGLLAEFLRRVTKTGDVDAADEVILTAVTREIDVRRRLMSDYAPDFLRAESGLPAHPSVTMALAGVFLLSAVQADGRGDRALALKRLNTAWKAADLGRSDADCSRLQALLLAATERICAEAT